MKHNTKIVITGGEGVLGSRLLKRLISKNKVEILVLDRNIRKDQKDIKNVKFLECDIANSDISKFLKDVDYVFHLACIKPKGFDISPFEYLENIKMTLKVAKSNKKAKIIYASGNNVYGISARVPINEKDSVRPTELYGLSKLCNELILEMFSEKGEWPFIILRIANVYGPEFKRKEGILFNFFNKLSKNKPLKIYGDGSQKRDRVWIEDVVDAFILAMNAGATGVFNIGSGESYSTIEVARLISEFLKREPKFIFEKDVEIKKKDILLDIQKARKVLNYNPKTNFKEGLKLLLDNWSLKL